MLRPRRPNSTSTTPNYHLLSTEKRTKRPHQTKGPANHEARVCIRRSTLRSAGEDGEAWPALQNSLEREQGYGSPHQNADRLQSLPSLDSYSPRGMDRALEYFRNSQPYQDQHKCHSI